MSQANDDKSPPLSHACRREPKSIITICFRVTFSTVPLQSRPSPIYPVIFFFCLFFIFTQAYSPAVGRHRARATEIHVLNSGSAYYSHTLLFRIIFVRPFRSYEQYKYTYVRGCVRVCVYVFSERRGLRWDFAPPMVGPSLGINKLCSLLPSQQLPPPPPPSCVAQTAAALMRARTSVLAGDGEQKICSRIRRRIGYGKLRHGGGRTIKIRARRSIGIFWGRAARPLPSSRRPASARPRLSCKSPPLAPSSLVRGRCPVVGVAHEYRGNRGRSRRYQQPPPPPSSQVIFQQVRGDRV